MDEIIKESPKIIEAFSKLPLPVMMIVSGIVVLLIASKLESDNQKVLVLVGAVAIIGGFVIFYNDVSSTTVRGPLPAAQTGNVKVAPVVPTSSEKVFTVIYAKDDGLNLRKTPGTSGTIITTLQYGTQLALVESGVPVVSDGERWWPVRFGTTTGWVAEFVPPSQRFIKPKLAVGNNLLVSYSMYLRLVALRGVSNCEWYRGDPNYELSYLTGFQVLRIGKSPSGCAYVQDRDWLLVQLADGRSGWFAEFGSETKAMLASPKWYIDLASKAPLDGEQW